MSDKADGLNRASSIETNPYKQSSSGAPWSKKNDGSKSTTGGPTTTKTLNIAFHSYVNETNIFPGASSYSFLHFLHKLGRIALRHVKSSHSPLHAFMQMR